MAQLVARFHGMEEVRGSNPLSSTCVKSRDIAEQCPGTSSCIQPVDVSEDRFGAVSSVSVPVVVK